MISSISRRSKHRNCGEKIKKRRRDTLVPLWTSVSGGMFALFALCTLSRARLPHLDDSAMIIQQSDIAPRDQGDSGEGPRQIEFLPPLDGV
jgi:hypothetical protein